jgi:hypothetical protein
LGCFALLNFGAHYTFNRSLLADVCLKSKIHAFAPAFSNLWEWFSASNHSVKPYPRPSATFSLSKLSGFITREKCGLG